MKNLPSRRERAASSAPAVRLVRNRSSTNRPPPPFARRFDLGHLVHARRAFRREPGKFVEGILRVDPPTNPRVPDDDDREGETVDDDDAEDDANVGEVALGGVEVAPPPLVDSRAPRGAEGSRRPVRRPGAGRSTRRRTQDRTRDRRVTWTRVSRDWAAREDTFRVRDAATTRPATPAASSSRNRRARSRAAFSLASAAAAGPCWSRSRRSKGPPRVGSNPGGHRSRRTRREARASREGGAGEAERRRGGGARDESRLATRRFGNLLHRVDVCPPHRIRIDADESTLGDVVFGHAVGSRGRGGREFRRVSRGR